MRYEITLDAGRELRYEGGCVRKEGAIVEIDFQLPFPSPPVVVLTPMSPQGSTSVQEVEKILEVRREGFAFHSSSHGAGYHVMWLAVGYRD
jgi:hypothetical protein